MQLTKKGISLPATSLTKLIMVLIGGFLLIGVMMLFTSDQRNIDDAILICKSSVDARELASSKQLRSAVPLLCKTIDIEIPEKQYEHLAQQNYSKAVLKNIADRTMDCWRQFGEGTYDKNVFGTSASFSKNKCFSCFTFTIKQPRKDNFQNVSTTEFINFLSEEIYQPLPQNRPFCTFDEDDEEHCIKGDAPECVRKGGICDERKLAGLVEYDGWSCDSRKITCQINERLLQNYMDYLSSKATGAILIDNSLNKPKVEPSESNDLNNLQVLSDNDFEDIGFNIGSTYSISFISETTDYGWTVVPAVTTAAIVGASIATGGGAALTLVGVKALFTIKSGLMVVGVGSASGATNHYLSDIINSAKQAPTIYISKISETENKCNVIKDFNQK